MAAASLDDLFHQADLLNDLLGAKLYSIGIAHGAKFVRADVKNEARAMQKVSRTYGGDWRSLSDLCRASLIFDTVTQLSACLEAIGKDQELLVVPAGDRKMRFRDSYAAGYRDVQLTVTLDTKETRARGVQQHRAEVQLHLAAFVALKTEGGHKNYVRCRNLRAQ